MNMRHELALGIVSDEVAPDFGTAVQYGLSWGITRYELRCLTTGRVPLVDRKELDGVAAHVKQDGIRITALSPGIFKSPLADTAAIERELADVLPATLDLAAVLACGMIIVFGFQRQAGESGDRFHRAAEYMRRAAEAAAKYSIRIAIENEPGFWCDTGENTCRMITTVAHSSLGANWDPCNAYGTDETPYPDGYEALKDRIVNVHAKDTSKGSLIQCVPIGAGAVDWRGQIAALLRDGIVGHVTIETHCLPLIDNSRHNVEILRQYMQASR